MELARWSQRIWAGEDAEEIVRLQMPRIGGSRVMVRPRLTMPVVMEEKPPGENHSSLLLLRTSVFLEAPHCYTTATSGNC